MIDYTLISGTGVKKLIIILIWREREERTFITLLKSVGKATESVSATTVIITYRVKKEKKEKKTMPQDFGDYKVLSWTEKRPGLHLLFVAMA